MTDHTPAQTLRAAANLLREAATEATHDGRTTWRRGHTLGTKCAVVLDDPDKPTVLIETYAERLERVNAYLELVGPATGLALAEWLDAAAKSYDASVTAAERVWGPEQAAEREQWVVDRTDYHALATARAILGDVTE